jgi:ubiquinone/menaquinone biosynthesis C-methylase UbiE
MLEGPVILDIGGEGRNDGAWNLNPRTHKTVGSERGQPIPRLIQGRGESIPLADRSVDVVIVERTPLRPTTLAEIRRIAKPAAQVILRHAQAHQRDPHVLAVQALPGTVRQGMTVIGGQSYQQTVIQLS